MGTYKAKFDFKYALFLSFFFNRRIFFQSSPSPKKTENPLFAYLLLFVLQTKKIISCSIFLDFFLIQKCSIVYVIKTYKWVIDGTFKALRFLLPQVSSTFVNLYLIPLLLVSKGCQEPMFGALTIKVPHDKRCLYEFTARTMSRKYCFETDILSHYSDPVFYGKS